MRIVVDLQGCQSSAHGQRGIGRYAMALVRAMASDCGDDELLVVLNGSAHGDIGRIRAELADVLPAGRIVVWHGIDGTRADEPGNRWRGHAARLAREDFLRSLHPDVVHVSSFFEGFIDDTVTSIPEVAEEFITAVTLYDLIPLVNQDVYLSDQRLRDWYFRKIGELKRADLLLGISAHTCEEAAQYLDLPADRMINISAAVDPAFVPGLPLARDADELRDRLGLTSGFVMYTGGIDHRKNVDALIAAYARLPAAVRKGRQLVIVCSVSAQQRAHLLGVGRKAGLADGELVLTGYVSSRDLVMLYQLCELFVFPSWHEGFGLPVLEAMACGAAVIGANTSSIPEVIGRQDALFDPRDVDAIAAKLAQVLQDPGLRAELAGYGVRRAQEFGWDRSARAALAAMRARHHERTSRPVAPAAAAEQQLPRLAFVSPLPPERSGIADYSAELLPALARYYRIEVVNDQSEVADSWISRHAPVRSVDWFRAHADRYDRVLYHFGNSPFHGHMFELLEHIPGTVVLHDFFLSGIASHLEWVGKVPGYWTRALYASHGYRALMQREEIDDPEPIVQEYPCNADVLEHADGIVVHSRFSAGLADEWYGAGTSRDWSVIPLLRAIPTATGDKAAARELLGLEPGEMLVCCFGILSPLKLNHVILDAWLGLPPDSTRKARLVFVGASHDPRYDAELKASIAGHVNGYTVSVTDYVDQATYRCYLAAADIGIQLRTSTRGETSAAVLDCMASAIPTIVNAHGSMAELPADVVLQLPDQVTASVVGDALASLLGDADRRRDLGKRALDYCRDHLDPDRIAAHYRDAIERYHRQSPHQRLRRLATELAGSHLGGPPGPHDLERLAIGVASNGVRTLKTRQFLVDVSELARRDAKSGIQRVVRSILMQLLAAPPEGYRVEPVYAEPGARYRYARRFTAGFLGLEKAVLADDVIDVEAGDILLGIDLALEEVPANASKYQAMRDKGAAVYFVVYDLLPLILAEHFPPHAYDLFGRWLETLTTVGDGALCISRAVADELLQHLDAIRPSRPDPFRIGYFHLGADIDSSVPSNGISERDARDLAALSGKQVMLMVGTIEPRKGHAQALDAFDELSLRNSEVALVLVGRPGWMTEALVDRIRSHPQLGKRLFWFDGASDEVLARIYALAHVLLVPSRGEGFGLPLIEAAQHHLPVICRDLPVFREIAGSGATYFSGDTASDLAVVIEEWMAMRPDQRPTSAHIPRITWRQSRDQLVDVVTRGRWLASWDDHRGYRFPAYDRNVVVEAGCREMGSIVTDGRAGMLLCCKATGVRSGSYRFRIFGEAATIAGAPTFELLRNGKVVAEGAIDAAAQATSLLADVGIDFASDDSVFQSRLWVGANTHLRVHHCVLEPIAPR